MTATYRAGLYMTAAHMGGFATVLLILATLLGWPDFVRGFSIGVLLISLVLLLRRKLRDEFIEGMWSSDTSLTFIALVVWFLFAPVTEGFVDGLFGIEGGSDLPELHFGLIAIAAFFVGFHYRWLRGRAE